MHVHTSTLWLDLRPKQLSIMSSNPASWRDPRVLLLDRIVSIISVLRVFELLRLVVYLSSMSEVSGLVSAVVRDVV